MNTTKKSNSNGKYPEYPSQKTLIRPLTKKQHMPSDRKNVLPEKKKVFQKDGSLKEEKSYEKKAEANSSIQRFIAEEFKKFHLDKLPPFSCKRDKPPPCHQTESNTNVDQWNREFARLLAEVEQSLPSTSKQDDSPPQRGVPSCRRKLFHN